MDSAVNGMEMLYTPCLYVRVVMKNDSIRRPDRM